jgi:hypothetical protein
LQEKQAASKKGKQRERSQAGEEKEEMHPVGRRKSYIELKAKEALASSFIRSSLKTARASVAFVLLAGINH